MMTTAAESAKKREKRERERERERKPNTIMIIRTHTFVELTQRES
jgi:hypothetical protein